MATNHRALKSYSVFAFAPLVRRLLCCSACSGSVDWNASELIPSSNGITSIIYGAPSLAFTWGIYFVGKHDHRFNEMSTRAHNPHTHRHPTDATITHIPPQIMGSCGRVGIGYRMQPFLFVSTVSSAYLLDGVQRRTLTNRIIIIIRSHAFLQSRNSTCNNISN